MEQFELIFEKLKVETNVKDIDEFIELFNGQEEANKELYEEANILSDEVANIFICLFDFVNTDRKNGNGNKTNE